ncbi:type VII secretion protein EccB [Streptomyces sp. NA04227]|uniref:type VII secretion protein EccB n=1 Tax=Streptomyces sp. NA04227 TaxID=2742136 RepID=UPI001591FCA2|nr:type VII secretion protein EccB [Streptomyces sp. NA04227]QKW09512.1 type VII secretion protein EccB [Streptomyces sp. NA04227]
MASRRDELNAYTFAKRRTLASFVQPSPTGSEEGAPKPLRAVLPGSIVGVILLAGFGAWGMFKPTAPKGWDEPEAKVIIASDSTTRYVILRTDGKKQLHPVLNMASAKLLLDPDKGEVVKVKESVLDNGKIPHGPTIGIPYAPDRLPKPDEAAADKHWAVCERPGDGGRAIQKAAFVFAERDKERVAGKRRLNGGQLLYVQGPDPDRQRYIVDAGGTAYEVGDDELLLRTLVGDGRKPQRVSEEWLKTVHDGEEITFPRVEGTPGDPAGVPGNLDETGNRIGMVLSAGDGNRRQHYVVLRGRVEPVSDFTARLLLNSKQLGSLRQHGRAHPAGAQDFDPEDKHFAADRRWPTRTPAPVNSVAGGPGDRDTVCNVLRSVDDDSGRTTLSTWAGSDFPAPLPEGSSSAYVTPGSGQLYRQIDGSATDAGAVFLVTDTGLRYVLQSNSDSGGDDAGIGRDKKKEDDKDKAAQEEAEQAKSRLGYADVRPALVPQDWSEFVPTGPRLSTGAARQPQGS